MKALLQRLRGDRRLAGGVIIGSGLSIVLVLRAYDGSGGGSGFFQATLIGIAAGCVYAIAASGLVLTYTTTGIFNFAHGGVGMVAAFGYHRLVLEADMPKPLALLLVLGVLAPLVGLVLELVMRSFRGASAGTALTVTIALTILLIGVMQYAFQRNGEQAAASRMFGQNVVVIAGARIPWDDISYLILALVVAAGLRYLLKSTRAGIAMRAVVDNPDLAALTGAPPLRIARTSWILGTMLAATAGVLYSPIVGILDAINLTFFVLAAYGAAVFGRLRNLPLTFLGAITLGLLQAYAVNGFPRSEVWNHLATGLPGIFLFLVLLGLPDAKLTVGRLVGRDVPRVPTFSQTLVRGALFIPVVVLVTGLAGDYVLDVDRALVYGTLMLSVVLLTGYSGQISLGQYVFFGVGAFAMGKIAGGDSLLGMGAAALIAIPIGVVMAMPTIRLQGIYLALVTFASAQVFRDVIFQDTRIYGAGGVLIGRLDLFGLKFDSNRAFGILCGIVFVLVAILVLSLRRGPFGRRLAAMRDSQAACATLGMDVRRTKLAVFAIASGIAGLAGSLYGGLGFTASQLDFEPLYGVLLFLYAYVGGITTVTGALIGGSLFAALPLVQSERPDLAGLVFAVVAVGAVALGKQPNGIAGLIFNYQSRQKTKAAHRTGPAAGTVVAPVQEAVDVPV